MDSLRNSVASFGIEPHPVNAEHVPRLSIGITSPLTTLIPTAKVVSHALKMLRFCAGLATHQKERKPDKNFQESNVSRLRESHLGTAELQWPACLEQEENILAGCSKCRLARELRSASQLKPSGRFSFVAQSSTNFMSAVWLPENSNPAHKRPLFRYPSSTISFSSIPDVAQRKK